MFKEIEESILIKANKEMTRPMKTRNLKIINM